jgi:hypothetical protein
MGIFSNHFKQATSWFDPAGAAFGRETGIADWFVKKPPPTPPQVPNPNDASNAAQSQTDAMRMRRGLMANIYAGSLQGASSAPVTGKTTLGT